PKNPNIVWVGSGENNNQRSVAYGDGLYRTLDGGKSWKRVGLEKSEHIGRIQIDPRDSRVIWVAAYGPLWSSGGERGVYRSADMGETWTQMLKVSDDTGIADLLLDPQNPDTLYAAAHQRRRHVWTLVGGGPESALYKSVDAGKNWRKLESGLPKGDIGRIGLALSPQQPDVVYAIIEAEGDLGGFFRSTDRGESWEKRSPHSTSGNYYSEIFADPHQFDRVYSMDTFLQVSDDGGKSFRGLGEKSKHVDNHVIWVDPKDADHYLVGCDGGLYESFDRATTWRYFDNLPLAQFYRVGVDTATPFYNVCGGTQDNFSLCGPSQTPRFQGPANADWETVQGGDGFWTVTDPTDPNIVYAEAQHGALTRFDRKSGENIEIQPQPGEGEAPLRWNWDSPLVLSPHSPTRLYFAANRLFRSDDRGDSWQAISPDLSRHLDRNKIKVMGRIQRPEAVAKNASTSIYGNIVALAESPLTAGVLYVGTDDGLIQISEDGGGTWQRSENFPGVPVNSYVSRVVASRHDAALVYAAFDNHKMGDFKPYVLRSADRGRTWAAISGDLPVRGTVYAVVEDPRDRNLLFAGTEFGLFFTPDGGKRWIQLTGGLPTIQVRDLAIQEREDDLVLATFGRGFYILDDLQALRGLDAAKLDSEAILFPTRTGQLFVPGSRIGDRANGFLGETFYTGANPPFGTSFTWYLKEAPKTRKETRGEGEKKAFEEKREIDYPTLATLRSETEEEAAVIALTVVDDSGATVRRLETKPAKGMQRLTWDLRYAAADPATKSIVVAPFSSPPQGPLAAPGRYRARLEMTVDGSTQLLGETDFAVEPLGNATLQAKDRAAVLDWQRKTARLQRAVLGAERLAGELQERLALLRIALDAEQAGGFEARRNGELDGRLRALELELGKITIALSGDSFLRARNEADLPSISERVTNVVGSSWTSTAEPTRTQVDAYSIAGRAFARELERLKRFVEVDLAAVERELEESGAPWTPGRLPV
ncbi:MAG: glycosyl hydrolase, partial [Thermoanaerobaculia bacterium]